MSGAGPNSVLGRVGWGVRVLRSYARIGWVRKSQFRLEFLNQVVMDCLFYVSFVLTFDILYGLDEAATLGGWTHAEMKVFLGMVFIVDAVMMAWMGQTWHFGVDLKNGALDAFRVRPGSTAFLYFFQRFSPEGLTNLVIASGWTLYALAGVVPEQVSLLHLAWSLPCALAVLVVSQVFVRIGVNLVELWLTHSDLGHLVSSIIVNLGERPLEIYPTGLKRFLIFVIPVAGLAWYPAALVLGRLDPLLALTYPLVIAAFAMLVGRGFRRGLRRYESAMG